MAVCMQTMMKRQYIVTVGWERCLVFYEDTKSDKRPLKPCRIVPDSRAGQQAAALNQGHTSDILTVAMQARLQARVPLLHAASAHGVGLHVKQRRKRNKRKNSHPCRSLVEYCSMLCKLK